MTKENANEEVLASSEPEVEAVGQVPADEPKMVPLQALEAERRKRQDAEAQARLLQDYMDRSKVPVQEPEPEEDAEELLNRGQFRQEQQASKREIREEIYKDINPKAMEQINLHLQKIIDKKPWLADSIKGSENRYARAYEIVEDYKHMVEPTATKTNYRTGNEGERIVANAQKPGSPVQVAKASPTSNAAYLKSIQGTKEFREYRQKAMRGEL